MNTGKPFYGICLVLWLAALVAAPWWMHSVPSGGISPGWLRLIALIGAFLGLVSFFVGIGIDVAGTPLGILLSGRNAYSLSRLQMLLWTVLALSALLGAAVARAWGIGGDGTVDTALSIVIPGNLLAAMGISYFTGFAAPAALSIKAQSASTPGQVNLAANRLGERIFAIGHVVNRPLDAPAKLADLVQGDDLATAGTVDLTKVQQLVITLLLVAMYFVMLLGLFYGKPFQVPVDKDHVNDLVTKLPDFDTNFLTLMAISHAGYLAYKVAPKAQASSGTSDFPSLRPTPPAR